MPAAKASTSESKEAKAEGKEGTITYEDHGDFTLEIDRRGPTEVIKRLPKTLRDVPVDADTQEEIEQRVEAVNAGLENEGKEPDPYLTVPPEKPAKTPEEPPSVTVTAEGEQK